MSQEGDFLYPDDSEPDFYSDEDQDMDQVENDDTRSVQSDISHRKDPDGSDSDQDSELENEQVNDNPNSEFDENAEFVAPKALKISSFINIEAIEKELEVATKLYDRYKNEYERLDNLTIRNLPDKIELEALLFNYKLYLIYFTSLENAVINYKENVKRKGINYSLEKANKSIRTLSDDSLRKEAKDFELEQMRTYIGLYRKKVASWTDKLLKKLTIREYQSHEINMEVLTSEFTQVLEHLNTQNCVVIANFDKDAVSININFEIVDIDNASIIKTDPILSNKDIYVVYYIGEDNTIEKLTRLGQLYKLFENNEEYLSKLIHIYVIDIQPVTNDYYVVPSSSEQSDYYDFEDSISLTNTTKLYLRKNFPSYRIDPLYEGVNYIYTCTPPKNIIIVKDIMNTSDLTNIIQNMQNTQNPQIIQNWKDDLRVFNNTNALFLKQLCTIDVDHRDERAMTNALSQVKTKRNQLVQNLLFYEEILKNLVVRNGMYALPEGQKVSSNPNTIIKLKFKASLQNYFEDLLDKDQEKCKKLIDLKKQYGGNFYIPNLYTFDFIFYKYFQSIYSSNYIDTEFNIQQHLDNINVGDILTEVINRKIRQDTNKVQLVYNEFIKNKMNDISSKLSIFIKDGILERELIKIIQIILDCTDFMYKYIPEATIDDLLKQIGSNKFNLFVNSSTFRNVIKVFYNYSMYCYEKCRQLLSELHVNPNEESISLYMEKLNHSLQVLPSSSSDLFTHNGLNGSMVESIFEFTVMYCDILNINTISDSNRYKVKDDLYKFIGLKKDVKEEKQSENKIDWLDSYYIVSFYKTNDIYITISVADYMRDTINNFVSLYYRSNVETKAIIHKFINQFNKRKNIIPPPEQSQSDVIMSIRPKYDISFLLKEQRSFRNVPLPELTKTIKDNMDLIVKEFSQDPNERTTFILLNRMNAIVSYTTKTERSLQKINLLPINSIVDLSNKTSDEQLYTLYDLHCKRGILFYNEQEVDTIHNELLKIIKENSLAIIKSSPVYSTFDEKVVTTILQTMGRYDLIHQFLFYSILRICIEISNPKKLFEIHPEIMLLNEDQHTFLIDLVDHLQWLITVEILPSDNIFLQLFSPLLNKYHIVDIDTYDPSTNLQWMIHTIDDRSNKMDEFISHKKYQLWMNTLDEHNISIFTRISLEYTSIINSVIPIDITRLRELINRMDGLLPNLNDQFYSFMNELRRNVIRMYKISEHKSPIGNSTYKSLLHAEMMLSYVSGLSVSSIENALFVHTYDKNVIESADKNIIDIVKPLVSIMIESISNKINQLQQQLELLKQSQRRQDLIQNIEQQKEVYIQLRDSFMFIDNSIKIIYK